MNNLVITEHQGTRVLTTQQLAEVYETTDKMISNNFNNNKARYQEGKHYILLQGEELKSFKSNSLILGIAPNVNQLYLWTEKGTFLHAKSLNTDKAWEVYDYLVDSYFDKKNALDGLSTELRAIILQDKKLQQVDGKIEAVNKDLQKFKEELPILLVEASLITSEVRRIGVKCLGGKASNSYKDNSIRMKVYSDIYKQLCRQFGNIRTYKLIKRNQCSLAIQFIKSYELPFALKEQITDCNAQMNMEVA
jgi:ORF6N domain./ORF6C domain.